MTHSFPPGGTLPRTGGPLLRPYPPPAKPPTQVDGYMSSPERGPRGYGTGPGYPGYDDPYYTPYSPRPGTITPVIDEEASDTEGLEEGYGGAGRGFKVASRPPVTAVFPQQQIDQTRLRVEHMERQLASLTGLVQKALTQAVVPGPPVPQTPSLYHRSASVSDDFDKHSSSSSASLPDKSVSFEKSVSFSDEPPDMNSPKQHSPQHPAESKPTKPAIKSSTLPRMSSQDRDRHKPTPPPKPVSLSPGQYESRNVYRDLQLTAEMYNHLRGLQKKAKDLRQEVRALRRMSQAQAHSVRETIRDTFLKIRAVLMSAGGEGLWCPNGDEARMRVNREGDLYRQQMLRLESDLTELEGTVEELRGNVINRKTRVNMSDVESMALVLSKSSKTVAELKLRFPSLQDAIKGVIAQEMEKVVTEEKFLKDEPERLESALRRCKKLTGTLVTLKRLASVQEQRLPESRLSPSLDETPPVTPTSGKDVPGEETEQLDGEGSGGGCPQRAENPLDALLDELQSFRGVRRLHSVPPPPPPRTSSKSPSESSSAESVASQPAPSRAELLEAKHRELLRKQRALQEQYTRLQSLQQPPDLLQLKKTGSESNLLGKMGLTLAPTGSLSHLAPVTTTSTTTTTATTTTSKIYETDIL
nr:coiled-coil domain-containing protein CG32809 isoform X2 [Halyomorpha halys]